MALEVTVDVLRRLLWARGVPTSATDDELLEASRDEKHKLRITLLTAFAAEGRKLTAEEEAELAHYRARIELYREAWKQVHAVAPNAYRVKGEGIAQYYPEGVLRPSSDLDVVLRDPAELWAAAQRMMELGWEIGAFTVAVPPDGGDTDLLVEAQKGGDEDFFGIAFGVELRNSDIMTTSRQPASSVPDPHGSPLAANTVALLNERWERQFTSRDRLDAALMASRYSEADQAALVSALTATQMWPEWDEMSRELRRLGWLPDMPLLRSAQRARSVRARRIAYGARMWGHPMRTMAYIARGSIAVDRGRLVDSFGTFVGRHIGAHRVHRLGAPVFGVPLPDPADGVPHELSLVRRGRHLVARSPVGEFLLVTSVCQQQWIEEAQAQ